MPAEGKPGPTEAEIKVIELWIAWVPRKVWLQRKSAEHRRLRCQ